MNLPHLMAEYLSGLSLPVIDYRPDQVGGDTFINLMPLDPEEAIAFVTAGGGARFDGYDHPHLQVRVRGYDQIKVQETAWDIYNELAGLKSVSLSDGTWMVICSAIAPPYYLGQDARERHEFTTNFEVRVDTRTQHRR